MTTPDTYELWRLVKDNRDFNASTEYMIWDVNNGVAYDWYDSEEDAYVTFNELVVNETLEEEYNETF